jgi:hypothetical protein
MSRAFKWSNGWAPLQSNVPLLDRAKGMLDHLAHWNNLALTFYQINRTCSRGVGEDTMPVADWLRSRVTDYEKKFSVY